MSQRDQGKHNLGNDSEGNPIVSKKRLDAQREPKVLTARRSEFDANLKSMDAKTRGGFNRPGSQQK